MTSLSNSLNPQVNVQPNPELARSLSHTPVPLDRQTKLELEAQRLREFQRSSDFLYFQDQVVQDLSSRFLGKEVDTLQEYRKLINTQFDNALNKVQPGTPPADADRFTFESARQGLKSDLLRAQENVSGRLQYEPLQERLQAIEDVFGDRISKEQKAELFRLQKSLYNAEMHNRYTKAIESVDAQADMLENAATLAGPGLGKRLRRAGTHWTKGKLLVNSMVHALSGSDLAESSIAAQASPEIHAIGEDFFDYAVGVTLETAPFMAVTTLPALIPGANMSALMAWGFSMAGAIEGNVAYQNALAHGRDPTSALLSALWVGGLSGAIEMTGGGGKFAKSIKGGKHIRKGQFMRDRVLQNIQNPLREGFVEELGQFFVQSADELIHEHPHLYNADGSVNMEMLHAEALSTVGAGITGSVPYSFGMGITRRREMRNIKAFYDAYRTNHLFVKNVVDEQIAADKAQGKNTPNLNRAEEHYLWGRVTAEIGNRMQVTMDQHNVNSIDALPEEARNDLENQMALVINEELNKVRNISVENTKAWSKRMKIHEIDDEGAFTVTTIDGEVFSAIPDESLDQPIYAPQSGAREGDIAQGLAVADSAGEVTLKDGSTIQVAGEIRYNPNQTDKTTLPEEIMHHYMLSVLEPDQSEAIRTVLRESLSKSEAADVQADLNIDEVLARTMNRRAAERSTFSGAARQRTRDILNRLPGVANTPERQREKIARAAEATAGLRRGKGLKDVKVKETREPGKVEQKVTETGQKVKESTEGFLQGAKEKVKKPFLKKETEAKKQEAEVTPASPTTNNITGDSAQQPQGFQGNVAAAEAEAQSIRDTNLPDLFEQQFPSGSVQEEQTQQQADDFEYDVREDGPQEAAAQELDRVTPEILPDVRTVPRRPRPKSLTVTKTPQQTQQQAGDFKYDAVTPEILTDTDQKAIQLAKWIDTFIGSEDTLTNDYRSAAQALNDGNAPSDIIDLANDFLVGRKGKKQWQDIDQFVDAFKLGMRMNVRDARNRAETRKETTGSVAPTQHVHAKRVSEEGRQRRREAEDFLSGIPQEEPTPGQVAAFFGTLTEAQVGMKVRIRGQKTARTIERISKDRKMVHLKGRKTPVAMSEIEGAVDAEGLFQTAPRRGRLDDLTKQDLERQFGQMSEADILSRIRELRGLYPNKETQEEVSLEAYAVHKGIKVPERGTETVFQLSDFFTDLSIPHHINGVVTVSRDNKILSAPRPLRRFEGEDVIKMIVYVRDKIRGQRIPTQTQEPVRVLDLDDDNQALLDDAKEQQRINLEQQAADRSRREQEENRERTADELGFRGEVLDDKQLEVSLEDELPDFLKDIFDPGSENLSRADFQSRMLDYLGRIKADNKLTVSAMYDIIATMTNLRGPDWPLMLELAGLKTAKGPLVAEPTADQAQLFNDQISQLKGELPTSQTLQGEGVVKGEKTLFRPREQSSIDTINVRRTIPGGVRDRQIQGMTVRRNVPDEAVSSPREIRNTVNAPGPFESFQVETEEPFIGGPPKEVQADPLPSDVQLFIEDLEQALNPNQEKAPDKNPAFQPVLDDFHSVVRHVSRNLRQAKKDKAKSFYKYQITRNPTGMFRTHPMLTDASSQADQSTVYTHVEFDKEGNVKRKVKVGRAKSQFVAKPATLSKKHLDMFGIKVQDADQLTPKDVKEFLQGKRDELGTARWGLERDRDRFLAESGKGFYQKSNESDDFSRRLNSFQTRINALSNVISAMESVIKGDTVNFIFTPNKGSNPQKGRSEQEIINRFKAKGIPTLAETEQQQDADIMDIHKLLPRIDKGIEQLTNEIGQIMGELESGRTDPKRPLFRQTLVEKSQVLERRIAHGRQVREDTLQDLERMQENRDLSSEHRVADYLQVHGGISQYVKQTGEFEGQIGITVSKSLQGAYAELMGEILNARMKESVRSATTKSFRDPGNMHLELIWRSATGELGQLIDEEIETVVKDMINKWKVDNGVEQVAPKMPKSVLSPPPNPADSVVEEEWASNFNAILKAWEDADWLGLSKTNQVKFLNDLLTQVEITKDFLTAQAKQNNIPTRHGNDIVDLVEAVRADKAMVAEIPILNNENLRVDVDRFLELSTLDKQVVMNTMQSLAQEGIDALDTSGIKFIEYLFDARDSLYQIAPVRDNQKTVGMIRNAQKLWVNWLAGKQVGQVGIEMRARSMRQQIMHYFGDEKERRKDEPLYRPEAWKRWSLAAILWIDIQRHGNGDGSPAWEALMNIMNIPEDQKTDSQREVLDAMSLYREIDEQSTETGKFMRQFIENDYKPATVSMLEKLEAAGVFSDPKKKKKWKRPDSWQYYVPHRYARSKDEEGEFTEYKSFSKNSPHFHDRVYQGGLLEAVKAGESLQSTDLIETYEKGLTNENDRLHDRLFLKIAQTLGLFSKEKVAGYEKVDHPGASWWDKRGSVVGTDLSMSDLKYLGAVGNVVNGRIVKKFKQDDEHFVTIEYRTKNGKGPRRTNIHMSKIIQLLDKAGDQNSVITPSGILLHRMQFYAPSGLAKNFNAVTKTNDLRKSPFFHKTMQVNAILKMTKLLFSLFHQWAFTRSFLIGGPFSFIGGTLHAKKAYDQGKRLTRSLTPAIEDLIRGSMTLFRVQDFDRELAFKETGFGKWLSARSDNSTFFSATEKGWKKFLNLRDRYNRYLFGIYGSSFKAMAGLGEYRLLLLENAKKLLEMDPDTSEAELQGLQRIAARTTNEIFDHLTDDIRRLKNLHAHRGKQQFIKKAAETAGTLANNDFGGLNMERMGISSRAADFLRLTFLGPDWTASNVLSFLGMVGTSERNLGITKGLFPGRDARMMRRIHQKFWQRIAVRSVLTTFIFNLLMAGLDDLDTFERYKIAWKSGNFRWLGIDVSPIYQMLGGDPNIRKFLTVPGHFVDPLKFIFHPGDSFFYKSSAVLKPVLKAIKGQNFKKERFTNWSELPTKGPTSWYTSNKPGGIKFSQLLSWALDTAFDQAPIPLEAMMDYFGGELDAWDNILELAGPGGSTTY